MRSSGARRVRLQRWKEDWGENGKLNDIAVTDVRIRVFVAFVVLGLSLIIGRLWYLQIYRGEIYLEQANTNRLRSVREVAPRGVIEDRDHHVLVTNGAQFTVFLTDRPKDKSAQQQIEERLASILDLTYDSLEAIIKRNDPGGANPIPVAEGISQHTLAKIAENRRDLTGVLTSVEPIRKYPGGSLAAHLLGSIGQISDKELAKADSDIYKPGDFVGKTGVEKQYDDLLNGTSGGRVFEVDARGRRRQEMPGTPVVAGATLTLALDREVQLACEAALNGRKGAAVAIDPRNGKVLAMASWPAYDPTIFTHRPISRAVYNGLMDDHALYNRALLSGMPPGSTFKIVTSAAGLGSGTIGEYTSEFCAGGVRIGNRFVKCDGVHGEVDLTTAIEASCDTFFYRRGLAMGPDVLADWAGKFGLGQKTGIDLPYETPGNIPTRKHKRAHLRTNSDGTWYPGDTANMAIGQGYTQATPMQMALVAAAIGNGGTVYAPRVVLEAKRGDGSIAYTMQPTVTHKLPLTPAQIARIAHGMREVVIGPRGTSHAANLAGVEVAGKSGSAETKTGGPTHAWFTCYAPFENPTIAVCVFLDSDGKRLHGGVDAAPIARRMIAAYLHVPNKLAAGGGGHVTD